MVFGKKTKRKKEVEEDVEDWDDESEEEPEEEYDEPEEMAMPKKKPQPKPKTEGKITESQMFDILEGNLNRASRILQEHSAVLLHLRKYLDK